MSLDTSVGARLRDWRRRRRMTQMELAGSAGISTRHMSFMETGRSLPSRAMLLRLSALLDVPLRDRNGLMVSAGYAPIYREQPLDTDAMAAARVAIEQLLTGHEPYPALAVDRHWQLVAANRAFPALLAGAAPALLQPPVNVLRLSLHPDGVAPRIANLPQWRAHVLERLRHQWQATADPVLAALLAELQAYPCDDGKADADVPADALDSIVVPLQLHDGHGGLLSFFSTTTVFGTPRDITLSELAIESFFPADARTAAAMRTALPEGDHGSAN
ncbi:helix-turn-helix domain-containing protein [Luteimonas sp. BDR2-5]|uniref:MmyB family transcriptional regulator n=1 Tax=Proluteimonas luteida TaxID=2878685 RepID=UPI001E4B49E8|nr:helix-turn-helix domain-containing protein [Luteimonas sp. BDR2-5]MCD9027197.1 helix-turn-helix domain-containing protein [Luteimonas sp. BDR2-5]